MKTRTKSVLSLLALSAVMSTQAFAERGDSYESELDTFQRGEIQYRFQDADRGNRYRRDHRKKIDICQDVKQKLAKTEERYFQFEEKVRAANKRITAQQNRVNGKANILDQKQATFNSATSKVAELNRLKQTKPRTLLRNKAIINSVNGQLPAATQLVRTAEALKKKKCKDWGGLKKSCKSAKKALKRAKTSLNTLVSSKTKAQNTITILENLEVNLTRANKTLRIATKNYSAEKNAQPTLAKLEVTLNNLITQRDNNNNGYAEAEEKYYNVGLRKELCMETQFEARKAKAFKHAMLVFVTDNGNGCNNAFDLISNTRGYAAKEGVKEAHDLVCKSDTLVREVEIEVEIPGQCSEPTQPTRPTQPTQPREQTITLDSPIVSVNRNNEDGVKNAIILRDQGAKQIKVDIHGYDIENNYDYLSIEDGNGNEVARFDNPARKTPETGTVTSGWVQGDTLILRYVTDGATLGQGFEIDSFQVIK